MLLRQALWCDILFKLSHEMIVSAQIIGFLLGKKIRILRLALSVLLRMVLQTEYLLHFVVSWILYRLGKALLS